MVWKSPRRQHGRGSFSEASSSSSHPILSSPAEIQVREIASRIGLQGDSEILTTVCHKMRKEYVVEEWQLPVLDSRQWEKMHAPIGLAVAVRHISANRLQERQQMQLPFLDLQVQESKDSNYGKRKMERGFAVDEKDDLLTTRNFAAKASRLPSMYSTQQEESRLEAKSRIDSDPLACKLELSESPTKSMDLSTISTIEKIDDDPVERQGNQQGDERRHPSNISDDHNNSEQFSEDCADWLKLVMVATAREEEEALERKEECKRGSEVTSTPPKINTNNDQDVFVGKVDSTTAPAYSATAEEAQVDTEPMDGNEKNNSRLSEDTVEAIQVEAKDADKLEWQNQPATAVAEKKHHESQNELAADEIEPEIPTLAKKDIIESAEDKTQTLHSVEQVSFTATPRTGKKKEASPLQNESNEIAETESETIRSYAKQENNECDEIIDRNERDSATTSMNGDEKLDEDIDAIQMEVTPETISSDSESEDNTNIFSGFGPSVSFSEDEDEERLGEKNMAQLDCLLDPLETTEDTALSSGSDPDNNLLLYTNNDADDITVAVSNVSPECKKSASKRKKKVRKYRHEYDRETSSFELETAALQDILVELPDDDHRAILSQLMIMTNARDKVSRINIAFQVQDSLVALIEKNDMDVDSGKAVQLIFHLARLKKSYRLIFGKSLFKAMSKLYKQSEKLKEQSKKEKNESVVDLECLVQEQNQSRQNGKQDESVRLEI